MDVRGLTRRFCRKMFFFFSSRRRHTRLQGDWSSDVCSSDLAGATTDAVSRLMANALQTDSGSTVIVDNRSGAGGNIGTEAAARAEADGYTLLLGALGPMAANPALYSRLNFDPAKDFTPLAWAASVPLIWAVHPSFSATTAKEALEWLRKNPGKFSYASAGNGTPQHLAGEQIGRAHV